MVWRKKLALLTGMLMSSTLVAQDAIREGPATIPTAPAPVSILPEQSILFHEPATTTYIETLSFSGDYLWWWMKRAPAPAPYITTTKELGEGIPDEFTGALGDPNTQILVGDNRLNFGTFSGLRLRAAATGPIAGLEIGGFLLERRSGGDFIASDLPSNNDGTDGGFPFLARSFFDVLAGQENAYFVSVPTFTTGSAHVSNQVELFGYEANATARLACWNCTEITGFVGHRFLGLNEKLYFNDRITSLANLLPEVAIFYLGQPVFRDGVVSINDTFKASNRFYAGQFGAITRTAWTECLTLSMRSSLAFGVNQQIAQIDGFTQLRPDPNDMNQNIRRTTGGVYAQDTNIGRYFQNQFSWAGEAEFGLEYQFIPNWTARIGYSVLHWRNVLRPGNLIDRRLDPRSVPSDPDYDAAVAQTSSLPAFQFKQSDLWVYGFTFGLEVRY